MRSRQQLHASGARPGGPGRASARVGRSMPRSLLKKFIPDPQLLQGRWYLRIFGTRLTDPRLWSLNRRGVTGAFGVRHGNLLHPAAGAPGAGVLIAVVCGLNIPVAAGTTCLVNPFTMVPFYYVAYRVGRGRCCDCRGSASISCPAGAGSSTAGPVWKPFLLGCLVCGWSAGFSAAAPGTGLAAAGHRATARAISRARRALPGPTAAATCRAPARDAVHAAGELRSCVTTTRLVPRSRLSSSISAKTLAALRPSRLPVGSSASTRRGAVTSARATAARWRSPPESWCGRCSRRAAQADPLEQRARGAARLAHPGAPHQQRHGHVLQRGELRQQMMELVDEADGAVAQRAALVLAQARGCRARRPAPCRCSAGRVRPESAAGWSCRNRRHR